MPSLPEHPIRRLAVVATVALLSLGGMAACGGNGSHGASSRGDEVDPNAPDESPPGDIPDNQAFVPYQFPDGSFTLKVPEGWSRTEQGGTITFTDNFNSIMLSTEPATVAPTVDSATSNELAAIAAAAPGYEAGRVEAVTRSGGPAIRISYRSDSPPDAVTGRTAPLDVERYEFFDGGREIVLVLSGPRGADNVDPWRLVSDSVRYGS